jgi:biofilm PGA synthesis N-glycosyltransferase PgaC
MSAFALVPILILSLYTVILILFSIGLSGTKFGGYQDPKGNTRATLLIPFRNEAENLPGLLDDLYSQTYPSSLFQVVFIDDHSEDNSRNVVESLTANRNGYSCLTLPIDKTGKKDALYVGVQHAENDWIIQVDADCRIDDGFIAAHISHLERHPSDLVAGLVITKKESGGFMESFERLDLLSMGGVAAASFILKKPMMCSGANLAYSKELYLETRSYDPSGAVASGDDMFLMIGARKLGRSFSYLLSPQSVVRTKPVLSLSEFIKQRVRWGSKTLHYRQSDIQLLAILVVLTNMTLLLTPVWIFYAPDNWAGWLGMWAAKTLADGALIYNVSRPVNQQYVMKRFLLASIVYYPVFLMILIRSIFGPGGWKGRIFK